MRAHGIMKVQKGNLFFGKDFDLKFLRQNQTQLFSMLISVHGVDLHTLSLAMQFNARHLKKV